MSPTIQRIGPYRFFFYSNEGFEPPHVHIQEGRKLAKFWFEPMRLARSAGFSAREINVLSGLVQEHESEFLEAWNDFFRG